MPNYRVGRISQEILKEVTDILRKKVRDPRITNVTVTDVEVTGDLQQATVFYSSLEDDAEKQAETQTGLDKATGLIRKELGSRLKIYKTPELKFVRDQSIAYGNRIDQLLQELNKNEEQ